MRHTLQSDHHINPFGELAQRITRLVGRAEVKKQKMLSAEEARRTLLRIGKQLGYKEATDERVKALKVEVVNRCPTCNAQMSATQLMGFQAWVCPLRFREDHLPKQTPRQHATVLTPIRLLGMAREARTPRKPLSTPAVIPLPAVQVVPVQPSPAALPAPAVKRQTTGYLAQLETLADNALSEEEAPTVKVPIVVINRVKTREMRA